MNQAIINTEEVEEIIECPICMDPIEEKNKVITECNHCFHTSCLMKNVAHNGFSCPYCRDAMAEEPESDEEYDEFSIDEEEEGPDYNDNVLRGARWLFQRAEGEEVDDDEDSVLDEEEENDEPVLSRPSVEYIVEKLVQQGVTMADLVKSILLFDHDEFQDEESFERGDSELFGKLRIIISNYEPPAVAVAIPLEIPSPIETSHHQSSRLRQIDAVSEDELYIDNIDAQLCNTFYVSEREKRYEKISSESILAEKKEERVIKMPFSFQMKGACRHNESIF
jgi:hypothetical protein